MLYELRGNHFDQLYKLKNIKTDEISKAIYFKICIGISDYLCFCDKGIYGNLLSEQWNANQPPG